MDALHKHEMASPAGTRHMVLERDRASFEKRGYQLVGDYPGPGVPADETKQAPPLAEGAAEPTSAAASPSSASESAPASGAAVDIDVATLTRRTKAQLVDIASALGIETAGTNPQLVERIKAAVTPAQE